MRKSLICFNHYYTYSELTNFLQTAADTYPNLCTLESAGKSFENREIWAFTLTNFNTGSDLEKPAIYLDGNIHAGEVTGAMVCLRVIDYLLTNYGIDEEVTHLLDTRTFYVLPRVNPDGAELYLTTPYKLRSSVRPYPEKNIADLPGLHPEDINNDGKILQMRVRDDAKGEWKISSKDSRIMLPRRPGERGKAFYRLYSEGYIKDFNNQPFSYHRSPYGLDLNRNFPSNWSNENISGGPYPTSEPEVKTIVDFILAHKNIGALNCFHTTGGFYFRNPYTYSDEEMDADDLKATRAIAREGFYANGYSDIKSNNRSTLTEWAYEHLGIIGYTTELWNRQDRAGLTRDELYGAQTEEEIEQINLKLLRWNDLELCGTGFINWQEYSHPQLGLVEIGGWDYKYCVQNPPVHLLKQECHKNALWALRHAAALPECKITDINIKKHKETIYKITVQCENHGYLPSYITNKGKNVGAVKQDKVTLEGENVNLISGKNTLSIDFLEGYMNGQKRSFYNVGEAAKSTAVCSFMIEATKLPATINVKLISQRGGTSKKTITIEE